MLPFTVLAQTGTQTGSRSATAGTPAAASAQQPAPPEHPLTDAQAKELMQLTGTDKLKDQLVANATNYFQHSMPPYMPKDIVPDITSSLEKADVNTPIVGIYKKYLSTDDATKIIEFYKTSAGHDLVKASPQIMGEAQRSAGQTAQQTVREVMERHKTEIEAAQKAYQQQHAPPTLGPTPGASAPKTPAATPAPKG